MPYATSLHHFRWRKKKVNGFIIPPTFFYPKQSVSTSSEPEKQPVLIQTAVAEPVNKTETTAIQQTVESNIETKPLTQPVNNPITVSENSTPKVSALSLSSIRAKKQLQESVKTIVKESVELPTEEFTETEMLMFWNKFALRVGEKGQKIMESLMLMNDPKLDGTTIFHELPNEGSKLDFDAGKNPLLGYLRGHLHNHNIQIEIVVNETVATKHAFTPQEKFARLNERNPNLEILRKIFDLDL